MPRLIIAIIDTVATDIAGPIQLVRHEAPAIRFFSDVALDPQTMIHKHVEDYELWQLGILNDDFTIEPTQRPIITGRAWKAAQADNTNTERDH